ncbi:MAG: Polysaccharide biosynthesis protein [Parcubacteria group bacterium GW2011_GWA2_47_10b]|uniref:Polysaccharide biosynthesis protein C-terminal domain-containing protein n=1 Tax=Candidatus Ryanbacteria bacterium RIFCSPLOWO2_02_FULL_47_14 TaxID=1802129 RepID=A0A1G2GZP4_9BACT|nr:MAG: Polysaccharide biosynthesis protein [Parcubacteria group bacterium GW2011_GWA2_47_10b]OGZ55609.1 MAG: hypothetical protein A3J04_00610 [Candidatus Ryanbacteria bacterium RIFCSPLOWO2_02_FULL_47_14]
MLQSGRGMTIDSILRPAGRFLRTDIRYLAAGSFWLGIGKAVSVLVALVLSLLYARLIDREVYGEYRYILSVLGTLGIFAIPGVATAIVRSVARGYEGTFRRGGFLIFFCSFGITLVGLGVAFWFYTQDKYSLAVSLAIASLVVPLVEGLGNWRAYYEGKRLFREKTVLNIFSSIFYGAFMVAGILLLSSGRFTFFGNAVVVLVLSYLIGNAIPNILFFIRAMRSVPRASAVEPGSMRYGMHLSLLNAPATVANYLDALLLHAFIGPAALAVYSFAIALPEQLKSVFAMFATVSFPKLSSSVATSKGKYEIKKTLPSKIAKATFLTAGIVAVYIFAAPTLYNILFPAYKEAAFPSQIFALSLIFFPVGVFGTALKAEGNLKKIYLHELSMPFIQIGMLAVLIPLYGLWGAVLARLFARIANHILAFVLFIR